MFPLRDNIPSRTYPLVTNILIWANLLVFAYEASLGQELQQFIEAYGLTPARVTGNAPAGPLGVVLPFFTTMILHGSWFHVLGNVWFLWLFGDNVEDRLGHWRYLWFYTIAGLIAGLAHVLSDTASTVPAVGASGAIAGVLGAYLVLYPRARVATLLWLGFWVEIIEIPAVTYLGLWFLYQLLPGLLSASIGQVGGVAWWAHIGGFAAGFAFARLLCGNCALERHPEESRTYYR